MRMMAAPTTTRGGRQTRTPRRVRDEQDEPAPASAVNGTKRRSSSVRGRTTPSQSQPHQATQPRCRSESAASGRARQAVAGLGDNDVAVNKDDANKVAAGQKVTGHATVNSSDSQAELERKYNAFLDPPGSSSPAIMVISVEGVPGAGKSTLLKGLCQALPLGMGVSTSQVDMQISEDAISRINMPKVVISIVQEDVQAWTTTGVLQDMYDGTLGPQAFQLLTLISITSRIHQAVAMAPAGKPHILILERSLKANDQVFAVGLQQQQESFRKAYQLALQRSHDSLPSLPAEEYRLWLHLSPECAAQRVVARGRAGEQGVDSTYLEQLHELHCLWLASEAGVFTVNAEDDSSTVLLEATAKIVERINHRFPNLARSTDDGLPLSEPMSAMVTSLQAGLLPASTPISPATDASGLKSASQPAIYIRSSTASMTSPANSAVASPVTSVATTATSSPGSAANPVENSPPTDRSAARHPRSRRHGKKQSRTNSPRDSGDINKQYARTDSTPSSSKTKFYAVFKGRKRGVFNSWAACSKQVTGYSGNSYKSFDSEHKAKLWLRDQERDRKRSDAASSSPDVRGSSKRGPSKRDHRQRKRSVSVSVSPSRSSTSSVEFVQQPSRKYTKSQQGQKRRTPQAQHDQHDHRQQHRRHHHRAAPDDNGRRQDHDSGRRHVHDRDRAHDNLRGHPDRRSYPHMPSRGGSHTSRTHRARDNNHHHRDNKDYDSRGRRRQ